MKPVQRLPIFRVLFALVLVGLLSGALAQSYYGFASYQDYLNNFYAQNNQRASVSPYSTTASYPQTLPGTLTSPYLPTTRAITTTGGSSDPYNGFSSYQAYLDSYYAGQNVPSPTVDPCGFAQAMSILVSPNNCAPTTRLLPGTSNTSTAFNGYSSYQAYLDAFYARTGSTQATQQTPSPSVNNSATSGYYGYNSYNEYLNAFYALNNRGATTAPATNYNVDYSVTTTPTSTQGYFDFVIGQPYQFNNGLIMTVETLNDNRCPQGVTCVWQGDIAAQVRLVKDNDIRNVTVSIAEGVQTPQVVVEDTSVQFMGLGDRVNNADTLKTYIVMN